MRCIADANVLLPVLTDGHVHRQPALDGWQGCDDADVGLCLPVHMALLRLLTNARVMGSGTLRPARAQASDCEMVTFDKGFRSFAGLRLRLLVPAG